MRRARWMIHLMAGAALVGGCGEQDTPEHAEPADTIAPAPTQPMVPGADEPGPQPNRQ